MRPSALSGLRIWCARVRGLRFLVQSLLRVPRAAQACGPCSGGRGENEKAPAWPGLPRSTTTNDQSSGTSNRRVARSEERRVGKERRARKTPEDSKKTKLVQT